MWKRWPSSVADEGHLIVSLYTDESSERCEGVARRNQLVLFSIWGSFSWTEYIHYCKSNIVYFWLDG
jgi:hypothetical protein